MISDKYVVLKVYPDGRIDAFVWVDRDTALSYEAELDGAVYAETNALVAWQPISSTGTIPENIHEAVSEKLTAIRSRLDQDGNMREP